MAQEGDGCKLDDFFSRGGAKNVDGERWAVDGVVRQYFFEHSEALVSCHCSFKHFYEHVVENAE